MKFDLTKTLDSEQFKLDCTDPNTMTHAELHNGLLYAAYLIMQLERRIEYLADPDPVKDEPISIGEYMKRRHPLTKGMP